MLKNTTKMANRSGLNLKFFPFETYVEGQENVPVVLLDFANACNLELPSDMVWATGGVGKSRKVGFNNPFEGTLTISTQIVTPQIRAIQSGQDPACETTKEFTFTNNQNQRNRYYVIEADTVWKDTDGNIVAEHIIVYKALVNKNLTANYEGGDVDPQSNDIIFELAALDDGRVCKTKFVEEEEPPVEYPPCINEPPCGELPCVCPPENGNGNGNGNNGNGSSCGEDPCVCPPSNGNGDNGNGNGDNGNGVPCADCDQDPCVCLPGNGNGNGIPCIDCDEYPCVCLPGSGNGTPCVDCGEDPCVCPPCAVCSEDPCICPPGDPPIEGAIAPLAMSMGVKKAKKTVAKEVEPNG